MQKEKKKRKKEQRAHCIKSLIQAIKKMRINDTTVTLRQIKKET